MYGYLWWIFTWPGSSRCRVGLMLAAVVHVTLHFETFYAKLPAYQEFFAFNTVLYMWIALGVVKVIHEFGHGLSCKAFGGECHEMGVLLMCLSPALYCNVTDAWTLADKWKRIIISFAGIYVELVIAAIATFVWWYTPHLPGGEQHRPVPDGALLGQHGRVQRQPADAVRRLLHPGRLAGDPEPPRDGPTGTSTTCSWRSAWGSRCRRSRTWPRAGRCCSSSTRSPARSTAGW